MNYKLIYDSLVERGKNRILDGYGENHHIVPKSLGGNDDKSNLVKLTAREHFICHYLLTKIYPPKTKKYYSMIKAFMLMCWYKSDNQKRYVNSHLYYKLKEQFSEAQSYTQSGIKNSQYGTICIFNEKLRENKRLGVGESIPEGWERGSVFNWESRELRLVEKYQRELNRRAAEDKKIEHFKALWDKFINGKYSSIRDFARCEYDKSHVYLTKNWKKYIKDYENVKQGKSFNSY